VHARAAQTVPDAGARDLLLPRTSTLRSLHPYEVLCAGYVLVRFEWSVGILGSSISIEKLIQKRGPALHDFLICAAPAFE
jgi:hypothetical protein